MLHRLIFSIALLCPLIAAVSLQLATADESAIQEKTIYRIMFRIGSKADWKEAVEAGSPVESEEKAIELGKIVKDKFDRGGLAAFEIELRKIKIITRPATNEEQRTYQNADQVVPLPAVNTEKVTSNTVVPAEPEAATHSQPHRTQRRPHGSGGHTPTVEPIPFTTPGNGLSVVVPTPPADVVVPLSNPGGTDKGDSSSDASNPENNRPEATLVLNDGSAKPINQTQTKLQMNLRPRENTGEADSTLASPPLNVEAALDSLVDRLKNQSTTTSAAAGQTPIVDGTVVASTVPALAPALDETFFDARPVPLARPQVAKRIRVFRAGERISQIEYDVNGQRIETNATGGASETGNPYSGRPQADSTGDGQLVFNENAARGEEAATQGEGRVDAKTLAAERDSLLIRRAELEQRATALDNESRRLREEQAALDREKDSFQRRAQELVARGKAIAESVVEGRTANGTLANGKLKLNFKFRPQGRLIANDGLQSFDGNWTLSGNRVTIQAGDSTLTGTMNGNAIQGSRTISNGDRDEWSVNFDGLRPVTTLLEHQLKESRQRLDDDRRQHEQKKLDAQVQLDMLQDRRRTLKGEQSLFEDDFARHRKATIRFNNLHSN